MSVAPIRRPVDLAEVIAVFQRQLWLPNPSALYAVLGAVAAGMMAGPPVWMLLIGPPSSGKTVLVDALGDLADTYRISTFSEAGLLSASPDGTPGLLPQIGERGLLLFSDFTTILSQPREARDKALGPMREIYDGRYSRTVGNRGGHLEWTGKVNLVGACTEAIYLTDMSLLGERLTYLRLPTFSDDDRFLAAITLLETLPQQHQRTSERRRLVADFFAGLTLPEVPPSLTESEQERLVIIAQIGATCRTRVQRDGFKADVIELIPGVEHPARLVGQLGQLLVGMKAVGVPDDEAWRVVSGSCLDSVHPIRRSIVEFLVGSGREHATALIAGRCRVPETTARRHLQDLGALRVIEQVHHAPETWIAGPWLRDAWASLDTDRSKS